MEKKLLLTSLYRSAGLKIIELLSSSFEVVYKIIEKYLKKKSDNS